MELNLILHTLCKYLHIQALELQVHKHDPHYLPLLGTCYGRQVSFFPSRDTLVSSFNFNQLDSPHELWAALNEGIFFPCNLFDEWFVNVILLHSASVFFHAIFTFFYEFVILKVNSIF